MSCYKVVLPWPLSHPSILPPMESDSPSPIARSSCTSLCGLSDRRGSCARLKLPASRNPWSVVLHQCALDHCPALPVFPSTAATPGVSRFPAPAQDPCHELEYNWVHTQGVVMEVSSASNLHSFHRVWFNPNTTLREFTLTQHKVGVEQLCE